MKILNLFLLVIEIIMASGITAQTAEAGTVSGVVKDSITETIIQGASIYIPELNTGTITGDDGTFVIKNIPDGVYTVRASIIGYAPSSKNITVPEEFYLNFLLDLTPVITDEIVSTARGRQTRLNDIPGSAEVITDTNFHETNPVSIPAALSRRPGIAVHSEMPWSSRPVIRGLTKDQIILLVDGCRIVTATATAAQFGTIAHGDIERVELLKGPLSVLYGSGSTGGIVNIITRKGRFTPEPYWSLDINPTYESAANGISIYERACWSNSRFYMSLSQSNRKYTDYRAADELRIRNSQFEDRQTHANLGLKISRHHTFEGRFQYFSVLDAGLPGGEKFPPNALATYPTTSRTLADIAWTWRPARTWLKESKINAYYQPVDRKVKIEPNVQPLKQPHPLDEMKLILLTPTVIYPEAEHNVIGARWQNVIQHGRHNIVAGFEGWQKHMTSDRSKLITKEIINKDTGEITGTPEIITIKETPVPESRQMPLGVFAEDVFEIGNRSKITIGCRIDRIHTENEKAFMTYEPPSDILLWDERSDDDVSWSFVGGGIFRVTEAVDVNLAAARSFRSPTLEERYLYAELGGKLTAGDPEIDPEKGTFIEGGISATLGSKRFKIQGFLNSISDMVILKPGGEFKGQPADIYANAGRARIWGFEAGTDWVVLPGLLVQADISYVRGTDEKYGTDLPSMPPSKAHISGRWVFGKGFWVEPLITLVNKQNKVTPGERKTPGYGIFDISAGKSIFRTGTVTHDLVIGVKNACDKLYRDHLAVSRGYEMYGMGRSFFVSWRVNFDRSGKGTKAEVRRQKPAGV